MNFFSKVPVSGCHITAFQNEFSVEKIRGFQKYRQGKKPPDLQFPSDDLMDLSFVSQSADRLITFRGQ